MPWHSLHIAAHSVLLSASVVNGHRGVRGERVLAQARPPYCNHIWGRDEGGRHLCGAGPRVKRKISVRVAGSKCDECHFSSPSSAFSVALLPYCGPSLLGFTVVGVRFVGWKCKLDLDGNQIHYIHVIEYSTIPVGRACSILQLSPCCMTFFSPHTYCTYFVHRPSGRVFYSTIGPKSGLASEGRAVPWFLVLTSSGSFVRRSSHFRPSGHLLYLSRVFPAGNSFLASYICHLVNPDAFLALSPSNLLLPHRICMALGCADHMRANWKLCCFLLFVPYLV